MEGISPTEHRGRIRALGLRRDDQLMKHGGLNKDEGENIQPLGLRRDDPWMK